MAPICPACRSNRLRRRKRRTLKLLLNSFMGKWPYKCGKCGHEFALKLRRVTHSEDARNDMQPLP
jgi:DNA-directed RNA polymerase subunit RPC12/RpoP